MVEVYVLKNRKGKKIVEVCPSAEDMLRWGQYGYDIFLKTTMATAEWCRRQSNKVPFVERGEMYYRSNDVKAVDLKNKKHVWFSWQLREQIAGIHC